MIDWKPFLSRWSKELLTTDLASRIEPPPESADWLGFDPAQESDVAALERRLGLLLPPSYRSFLLTTNGWRRTTAFIARVRPAQEVDWFRVENEHWAEMFAESGSDLPDSQYFNYKVNSSHHRAEHMLSLIQISDVDDGVYLLNPEAVTPDGEWEAWFFANWVPGAVRFPSFAHLMVRDYRSFADLEEVRGSTRDLPKLKTPPPSVPRVPAERIRKKSKTAPSLDALIDQMRSAERKTRDRAVRTLFGKLKGRPHAERRPELVPVLSELFRTAEDPAVRGACIAALTEMADDGVAPEPLYTSLSDVDPGVILQGIFALHYFPNTRAVHPLCKFVDSRANILFSENAMMALREIGDERAIPTLSRVLLDTTNTFDQSFGTAAIALANCGPAGFDALVPALTHADRRVRHAAVVGIDVSGDVRAGPMLDRMESDPEPQVRDRARVRMGKLQI